MKNFLISLLLIAVLSAVFQQFLPWWSIALAGLICGFAIKQKSWAAFAAGFVAIFILWPGYAYMVSSANDHLLAGKVAELMKALTQGKAVMLYVITGLLGGLVAGFSALTGRLASNVIGR